MRESADKLAVRNRTGLLLFATCVFAASLRGESTTAFRRTVTEVAVTLVATDGSGRSVSTLSPADIAVLEDGRPVPNFALRAAVDNPLRLGIMLDLSDSTKKSWPLAEALLPDFLRQLIRPEDQAVLVAFDSKIEIQEMISDAQPAATLIRSIRGGGPTALLDAVYSTCGHPTFGAQGEPRRSALILFSDGEDNLSLHDLDQTIANALSRGIAVYTISVHRSAAKTQGDAVLRKLAESTGGRSFVVKEARQMRAALVTITDDLRNYYLLYYKAPPESGVREYRRVLVIPTRNTGPLLRYRQGYYTAPSSSGH